MDFFKFKTKIFSEIRNEEYHTLLEDIFTTIDDETIDYSSIEDTINNARKHLPIITSIANASSFHENTEIIGDLNNRRHKMLKGLRLAVSSAHTAETEEMRDAAQVLSIWMRNERKRMTSQRVKQQTGAVLKLQQLKSGDAKVSNALETLSQEGRFENIVGMTNEILDLTANRTHDIENSPRRVKGQSKQCARDLKTMFDMFAAKANIPGPERSQYYMLCKKIERSITNANSIIELRKTKNANMVPDEEKATEPDIDNMSEPNGFSD